MSLSRRELLGLWRRRPDPSPEKAPAPDPAVESPAPSPAAAPSSDAAAPARGFSLDSFYQARARPAAAGRLPHFAVRAAPGTATTAVGVGRLAAERGAAPPPAASVAIPAGQVPVVLPDACLATRSFCSICVERCPRPGAVVVEAGRPRVIEEACDGCGRCVAACPAPILAFALRARTAPTRGTS